MAHGFLGLSFRHFTEVKDMIFALKSDGMWGFVLTDKQHTLI